MIGSKRRIVVVNLVSGKTVVGRPLWSWPWTVRVADVEIADGAGRARADGVVSIPRRMVEFVQIT